MTNNQNEITIIKGSTTITFRRSEICECKESHDGIIFQLKNDIFVYCTDNFMDPTTKARIKMAIERIPNGNVTIDLRNPRNPVTVHTS